MLLRHCCWCGPDLKRIIFELGRGTDKQTDGQQLVLVPPLLCRGHNKGIFRWCCDSICCVTFYKGMIVSVDDYYQLSSEMVMLETTHNVYNHTLYSLVTPKSLLAWQRVRVANMMARSGREWYERVRRYNSGACVHMIRQFSFFLDFGAVL